MLLVAALILLNAAFAGSEIALISLREGQIRRLEQQGGTGRLVARLARDPNRFLATIQIGITLAGFLASATAAVALAEPLVAPLGFLGRAARPAAIVLVTAVLTFFTLVVGELAPKRVAMQRAERWAMLAARPLAGLALVARPVVWVLGIATDLTVRLMGGDPSREREEVTAEEIRDLLSTHRLYTVEQRRIIEGALEVTGRSVREVIVPRTQVVALPEGLRVDEALDRLVASGHSRAPVYRDEFDDADRVVAVMSLVGRDGTVADHASPAVVLPESADVVPSLRLMQRERQQMALVISEHGGIEGIVTVEDLVEEIVGEIHDEYDRDVRAVRRHPDGAVTVLGGFPVHDLEDIGVSLPRGDYVTVAGLVLEHLQTLPHGGETVVVGPWELRVDSVSRRRIRQVTIRRRDAPSGPEAS